jgi:Nucleotidyltransferase of unknown function (DUF6036)
MSDLVLLVDRLVLNEVEFVVVGGLAVMIYGAGLVTDDVDVCVPFTAENLARIHRALEDLHPFHRMTPQELPFVVRAGFEKGLRNLYLATDYAEARQHSVSVKTPAGEYRLLSIDKLIIAKEALDREKDRAAVRLLRSIRDSARPISSNPPPS